MTINKNLVFIVVSGIQAFFSSCCGNTTNPEDTNSDTTEKITHIYQPDYETITFSAEDGLDVYANKYEIDKTSPVIVLCHQAGFNKFEYEGTAQRLNDMGFNCIAIDQRSGGPIANQQNETNNLARSKGLAVDFLDAIPDITAAVNYAAKIYNQKVILWGSSYSSTLSLWEALKNDNVKAVVAFSPGDYFKSLGSLTDSLPKLDKPFFITAASYEFNYPEGEALNDMLSRTKPGTNQVIFKPAGEGHHGSRALWVNQVDGEEYWDALTDFLNEVK